eukprot:14792574-Alexandrium_andersonii.AAC.1
MEATPQSARVALRAPRREAGTGEAPGECATLPPRAGPGGGPTPGPEGLGSPWSPRRAPGRRGGRPPRNDRSRRA